MLVVRRKSGESVVIRHGGETLVVRVKAEGNQVRVMLHGPKSFGVTRAGESKEAS
jgi:sRNA-binding carbon storage regulator CsrA